MSNKIYLYYIGGYFFHCRKLKRNLFASSNDAVHFVHTHTQSHLSAIEEPMWHCLKAFPPGNPCGIQNSSTFQLAGRVQNAECRMPNADGDGDALQWEQAPTSS